MGPEIIKKIIEAGVHAPSGDNVQPWEFSIAHHEIFIFNIPEREHPFYSLNSNGSLVAHGMLLENIIIAASKFGYQAAYELFPSVKRSHCVAKVTFKKAEYITPDPLHAFIFERATNRRSFEKKPLSPDEEADVLRAPKSVGVGAIALLQDRASIDAMANAVSMNEIIALGNEKIHQKFFGGIVWTEDEEHTKKSGLYLKTLELPLPVQLLFRIFRFWPVMRVLNAIGFPKNAAATNAKRYAESAAIGVITVSGTTDKDYIETGRIFQRVWLEATKHALGLQPLAGALYLHHRMAQSQTEFLSPEHKALLKNAYDIMVEAGGVHTEAITMIFRIGRGKSPSARSSRMAPVIVPEHPF